MENLMIELTRRWDSMFAALAAGDEVPPGQRLRTEGMMEAVVLQGVASKNELVLALDRSYLRAYGRSIAGDFGEDWREFYPFPQIPAMGRRAPVYPSTSE